MPNQVALDQDFPSISRSNEWFDRARKVIPAGTQTLAKGPGQFVDGVAPKYLARGRGAHVWDVDGNEYIDFSMGVGPLSLGYAYPAVDEAILAQLRDGITFSLMHPLEVEVAELVQEVIPGAESVRFGKTGAEVTSAAVRLARAHTGRSKVLCCGYHGWHDWYISVTDRNRGIPEEVANLTFTFAYNDLDSLLSSLDEEVAAVILEPVTFSAPHSDFLGELRRACDRVGALLIFDEMWTGFRLGLGGAQARFDVRADLACFSKAVANGMPLSVLTGRRDVMSLLDHDVFFFSTFGGEALSLAAARATIGEMRSQPVFDHLQRQGTRLRAGIEDTLISLGLEEVQCVGYDCRTLLTFAPSLGDALVLKSLVQQELIKRGILWGGIHNLSYSHTDGDIDHAIAAYAEVLPILAEATAHRDAPTRLRGKPVAPVFRRTTNFDTKPRTVAPNR